MKLAFLGFLSHRKFIELIWIISLAIFISIVCIILSSLELTKRIELITYDWRFQAKQILGKTLSPSKDIVIVAIDEESAALLNPKTPTPRDYLAKIIDYLSTSGAKLIFLDVLFEEPTSPSADEALSAAIRKAGNVILSCGLYGDNYNIIKLPLGNFLQGATAVGFANVYKDTDTYIRHMLISHKIRSSPDYNLPQMVGTKNGIIFSQPLVIYAKYLKYNIEERTLLADILKSIPTDESGAFLINFAGEGGTFAPLPSQLFFTEFQPPSVIFKDKIVLIGGTHKDTRDSYMLTPFYNSLFTTKYMAGVEIIANALNTLMNQSFIHKTGSLANYIITFMLIILALVILSRIHPVKGIFIVISIMIVWLIFNFLFFSFSNYALNIMQPMIGFTLAYVYAVIRGFSAEIKRSRILVDMFQRHVSPEVMDDIIDHAGHIMLVDRKKVTVLFSDLKDSVPWAEELKSEPERLVEELNEYFAEMVDVIFQHHGTLLKFTGDGLIALYGAPLEHPEPAMNAVLTGIEMQQKLDKLNKQRIAAGKRELYMRIGINTGEAILGNIGSEKRLEYNAMGDTVNVAQRTEGQCEPGHVAITEYTYQEIKNQIEVKCMGARKLKGKSDPVMIYCVTPNSQRSLTTPTSDEV